MLGKYVFFCLSKLTGIDIHAHLYPKVYLDLLESCSHLARDEKTGSTFIMETGTSSGHMVRLFEEMWSLEKRVKTMDALGIDMEILSIGNPWLSYFPREKCKAAAKAVNTELSEIAKRNTRRFAGMGVLPFASSEEDALDAIDYAVDELGLRGFMVGTHANGRPIFSKEFFPIFERIERKGIPVFIHPLARENVGESYDRLIVTGLLFPNESTIAAVGLMTNGFLDKLPDLKIILAHLGGNLPISIGRIDRAVKTNPTASKLIQDTGEYLKRFYLDSIAYFSPAIDYAADIWGPEKIMLGSDSPWHWSGEYTRIIAPIEMSGRSSKDKELMLAENAKKLFCLS